jgi:regulator of sigma D
MAASKKAIENSNRLRYVRALERFCKSLVSYLSNSDELTKERYDKKIENALRVYSRVEEVSLYKGELQDMQKLVKKMIAYAKSDEDVQNIKEDLLYSANQLDKNKNARRYKKDKHSKSKYEDWD